MRLILDKVMPIVITTAKPLSYKVARCSPCLLQALYNQSATISKLAIFIKNRPHERVLCCNYISFSVHDVQSFQLMPCNHILVVIVQIKGESFKLCSIQLKASNYLITTSCIRLISLFKMVAPYSVAMSFYKRIDNSVSATLGKHMPNRT